MDIGVELNPKPQMVTLAIRLGLGGSLYALAKLHMDVGKAGGLDAPDDPVSTEHLAAYLATPSLAALPTGRPVAALWTRPCVRTDPAQFTDV